MNIIGSPAAATLAAHQQRAAAEAWGSWRPPPNWSTAYLLAGGFATGMRQS
jgi:hypothetical protein